jgi:hypothetical protein
VIGGKIKKHEKVVACKKGTKKKLYAEYLKLV